MAIGVKQSNGTAIPGFSAAVPPDRTYLRNRTPNVRVARFGDGYEQRKAIGINNFTENYNVTFVNRPGTEMDDLESFFASLNGVTRLMFTIENTNLSPPEEDVICVCDSWTVNTPQPNIRSISATLRRVYEP